MTVKQLRFLLRGLPGDIEVMLPLDKERLISVCAENSGVVDMQYRASIEEEDSFEDTVLLLVGCNCSEQLLQGSINSQPELN